MKFQTIPILRIFDEEKAKDFYLGFLGMRLDWEHRFDVNFPIYMQVSKGNLVFHLSEHSGDCTPGSKVFVNVDDLDPLYHEVISRPYKYSKPSIEQAPWGDRCFTVTDPFSNKVLFNEPSNIQSAVDGNAI
jgi:catechol 2,3-dioxygenase-like lactoylglutathione lyase family enzyme